MQYGYLYSLHSPTLLGISYMQYCNQIKKGRIYALVNILKNVENARPEVSTSGLLRLRRILKIKNDIQPQKITAKCGLAG